MSREVVLHLCEISPLLRNWVNSQFNEALRRDFTEFNDEPDAMIGIFIMEQSIAGFAQEMAKSAMDFLYEELRDPLQEITSNLLKKWI